VTESACSAGSSVGWGPALHFTRKTAAEVAKEFISAAVIAAINQEGLPCAEAVL